MTSAAPQYLVFAEAAGGATWPEVATISTSWDVLSQFTWAELSWRRPEAVRGFTVNRAVADTFNRLQIGRAQIVVDNANNSLSPEFNPLARPGKGVSIKAFTAAGSAYGMFFGTAERYLVGARLGERRVTLDCLDHLKRLRTNISLPLVADFSATSYFNAALAEAGFTAEERAVDTLTDIIPYAQLDNAAAGDVLEQLRAAGGHNLYLSGAGVFRVRDRNFDFRQTSVGSYEEFLGLSYELNDVRIINDARISTQFRKATTGVRTIAWIDQLITIPASGLSTFFIEYVDPDTLEKPTPASSLTTPVASSDYRANANPSGLSTDMTNSITLATFVPFAQTALVTFNNPTPALAYLTKFQVRGFPLQVQPQIIAQSVSTPSQRDYGVKTFQIDTTLAANPQFIRDYADFLVLRHADPIADIDFSIKNVFPDVYQRELLDRVTLVNTAIGINSEWTIVSMEHTLALERGVEHSVKFGVRLAETKQFFVLDVSTLDGVDYLGF